MINKFVTEESVSHGDSGLHGTGWNDEGFDDGHLDDHGQDKGNDEALGILPYSL